MKERLVEVILRTNIILIDRGASLHINKLIVKGYSLQVLEYVLGHVEVKAKNIKHHKIFNTE